MESPETTREISSRHEDEAVSIAIVSQQIVGLERLVTAKLGFQDTQLALIKEQTTKTNGKVADAFLEIAETKKELYLEIDRLKTWRAFLTGAWAVITAVVVPVMLYLLYQRLQ